MSTRRQSVNARPLNGPLAPWRLVLVMLAVATTSGTPLLQSVRTGAGLDLALGRALVVAIVLWVLLGWIDRVLARAELERRAAELDPTLDPALEPDPSRP
ncbi:MAG: hypothetical protein ACRDZZ_09110 [Ilumatobacteraceae bacterium]